MMKEMNRENFDQIAQEETGPFIINFYSTTCGPCSTMKPVITKFAEENSDINVYRLNSSENQELCSHFGIQGVPTTLFCENREILFSFVGVTPLRDLQFVRDNLDDPHFRETGEFIQPPTSQKKSWYFPFAIAVLAIFYFCALFLA